MKECLSDLVLDKLQTSSLDDAQKTAAEAHVTECAKCSQRIAAFTAYEMPAFGTLFRSSTKPHVARRTTLLYTTLVAAAALFCLITLSPTRVAPSTSALDTPITRTKGALAFNVLLKRTSGEVAHAADQAIVHRDDEVIFEVTSASTGWLGVFGVRDGTNAAVSYALVRGIPQHVNPGEPLTLRQAPGAIWQIGRELVVCVLCSDRRDVAEMEHLARQLAIKGSPSDQNCHTSTVILNRISLNSAQRP